MSTLVFDIETIGEAWDDIDSDTQAVLTRWIERTAKNEEEHRALLKDLKDGLGFSPLTGEIVALGGYDAEEERGWVYYQSEEGEEKEIEDSIILRSRNEKALLESFWEDARRYDTFVTFNGRGFDVPFILIRSMVHGVMPTRDLMSGRYLYQQRDAKHVDLQDQLSFYGAVYRRQSLHMYCRAFGIESPKVSGVKGDDVTALFKEGRYEDIARYNARDIIATYELYKKWKAYLGGQMV